MSPFAQLCPIVKYPCWFVGQTTISNGQFNLSIQCPNQCSILNQDGSILKILILLKDFVFSLLSCSINSCFSLNVCSKHVVFLVSWSNPPRIPTRSDGTRMFNIPQSIGRENQQEEGRTLRRNYALFASQIFLSCHESNTSVSTRVSFDFQAKHR